MINSSRRQFGPFLIDVRERLLLREGQPVQLTPKAFDLLAVLVERPGELISKDELLQSVWPGTFVGESNLAFNVSTLRKALADTAGDARYIETVPKRGYRFVAAVTPYSSETVSELSALPDGVPGQTVQPPMAFRFRLWSGRTAVVLATVLALVYVGGWARRVPPVDEPQAVPINSLTGVARSPSLSPDGTYVAFSWTSQTQEAADIYVQQIGAGAPYRLTTSPAHDYGPTWSPDGRTIAFLRRAASGDHSEIWATAPLGGVERKFGDLRPRLEFFKPLSVAWCPDSTCVIVTDSTGAGRPDALFTIDVTTGEKRQVTFPEGLVLDADPAVSPDGRRLVFRRDTTAFSGAFYTAAWNGHSTAGSPVRLTPTLNAGRSSWMPDSRDVVYASSGALWRINARDGGDATRLPFVGQDGLSPAVSTAGARHSRLVYVRSFADTNVWRIDAASAGAAASPPLAAIASTRGDQLAQLSPDGRRVVFLSDRSGTTEFWVANRDGSSASQLTSMEILPGYPRWSPDGRLIAFHGDPQDRPDILTVPASGGTPTILTKGLPEGGGYPSFSRDGRWVYFSAGLKQGEARIWKMPVAGGTPIQVTKNMGSISIEGADGYLYYVDAASRPGVVWRMPADGGEATKLLSGVVLGNFDVVDAGIYYLERASVEAGTFMTDRPGGEIRLQFYEFATGTSRTVATGLGRAGLGLTASADGRTILFSRIDSSVDELMLVDNFR